MYNCVFDDGERCSALKEKCCEGCRFRKTEEELIEGREKAKERVETLPINFKMYILNKYYSKRRFRMTEE